MDPVKNALAAFAENFALSSFEPEPIQFTRAHEKELPRVKAAIKRAGYGEVFQFGSAVYRNAFLCGCLDYTILERIEHLIVGYGYRHGSTSKIHAIHHVRGDVGAVTIPDLVERSIRQHESRAC